MIIKKADRQANLVFIFSLLKTPEAPSCSALMVGGARHSQVPAQQVALQTSRARSYKSEFLTADK